MDRGSCGERGWHTEGVTVPMWPECRGRWGTDGGQRGAAGELDDPAAPRIVIKIQPNSDEIEMKPFGLSRDVFLLKSLKLSSM